MNKHYLQINFITYLSIVLLYLTFFFCASCASEPTSKNQEKQTTTTENKKSVASNPNPTIPAPQKAENDPKSTVEPVIADIPIEKNDDAKSDKNNNETNNKEKETKQVKEKTATTKETKKANPSLVKDMQATFDQLQKLENRRERRKFVNSFLKDKCSPNCSVLVKNTNQEYPNVRDFVQQIGNANLSATVVNVLTDSDGKVTRIEVKSE